MSIYVYGEGLCGGVCVSVAGRGGMEDKGGGEKLGGVGIDPVSR